ncbi:hypothetical protein [Paenibacillus silagei]|uniref:Uncharacterized protein n=1 Tax=Paenibacillus silagei TaxID=1670801 RepID=A0ABS4NNY6_9BACL|nr:hypothetical protein [Paenibacillus silagei]MBP2111130.1 hypothetical protein [Paenibacillus silagei]
MNSKILPMKYPIITSWQWQANLFSILSNYPETQPWIYSNYIQLHMIRDESHDKTFVDFYQYPILEVCPWIYNQHLKRETILLFKKDICEFFIECIDLNNYIYGVFEQSYFGRSEFFPHDTFIYGYNKEKKVFYIADFSIKEKYSYTEVSFSQIEKAYLAIEEKDDWLLDKGGLQLLSFNAKGIFDFKPSLVIEFLEEFLQSKNSFEKSSFYINKPNKSVFGLEVYRKIKEDLINKNTDFRHIHVIYDHKVLMLHRIEYMQTHGYLNQAEVIYKLYKQLEQKTLSARNLLLKAIITQNDKQMDQIIRLLGEIESIEKEAMNLMLYNIKQCKIY